MTRSEPVDLALHLEVAQLAAGEPLELPADARERVVVVLGGSCSARFPGESQRWDALGERSDVFDGRATALYAPLGQACLIHGGAGGVRVAVVSAIGVRERAPYVVRPAEVRVERRGRGVWTRDVHDIVGPDYPADRILLGETFSTTGVWSGYPPHRHDRHDPPHESRLDEVFLVQVRPRSGFGVLVRYADGQERETAEVVHDGDILSVREGYHSFIAAGGHQFYYLWAIAGDERVLRSRTDRRHAWLLDEPPGGQP